MLTLTNGAVQVIRSVTEQPDLPSETGLRIQAQPGVEGTLSLSVTASPEAGDEVIEAEGARVYLESTAATLLDDKTLDAEVDAQGDVAFMIGQQA